MREPEKILEQVSSWRPESLAAYERRRRAQRTTEHDRLMAEAERMWQAELARDAEAAKGGRPPKDGKTLKGTGMLRLPKKGAGRRPKPTKAKAATVPKVVSRCACGAAKRGSAVACPPCTAARSEVQKRARDAARARRVRAAA